MNFFEQVTGRPIYMWQVIAPDPPHERTISWLGKKDKAVLQLSYNDHCNIVYNATNTRVPSADNLYVYTVKLRSLEPDTIYRYRVACGDRYLPWRSFITPNENKKKCTAIVFNMSNIKNEHFFNKTASIAYKNNKDADFFVSMGEPVRNFTNISEWKNWFMAIKCFSETRPLVPVAEGNHIYAENNIDPLKVFFNVPENGEYSVRRDAYSFDYGSVHFAVLDTYSRGKRILLNDERQWLDNDLSVSKLPWKVVLMYDSPWQDFLHNQPNELGYIFLPVLQKHHVDLVLTKNAYVYMQHTDIGKNIINTNKNRNVPGEIFDEYFMDNTPTYYRIDAGQDYFDIQGYKTDGKAINAYHFIKK
ncbi:purple acid phosphatase family protein [Pectinatus sottacetonis]|uniref:purple acid phosphatase family protein n=1 Tax=Pectinatus sottacetonis TaxID=1002795 RepID=UPI0018C6E6D7|nr:metallophosphoesterase family protein [Pectinatus sottacetonis]